MCGYSVQTVDHQLFKSENMHIIITCRIGGGGGLVVGTPIKSGRGGGGGAVRLKNI